MSKENIVIDIAKKLNTPNTTTFIGAALGAYVTSAFFSKAILPLEI
jgi:hypothetical protein